MKELFSIRYNFNHSTCIISKGILILKLSDCQLINHDDKDAVKRTAVQVLFECQKYMRDQKASHRFVVFYLMEI